MPKVLSAIGRFSARHRLIVITAWLVLFGFFTFVTVTSSDLNGGSTVTPSTAASKALSTMEKRFPALASAGSTGKTLQLVLETRDGAKVTTAATADEITAILDKAATLPHVKAVSNPLDPKTPYISKDGSTVVATLTFSGVTKANEAKISAKVVDFAKSQRTDFNAQVGGQLGADTYEAGGIGEIVGVLIAFLVLFLTFGSLITAGANMLVAIVGVGVGVVGVLAWSSIHSLDTTTITLPAMLGLAVGIDYSLFILTRFRAELRAGESVINAVGRATGTAGTAVVFAGLTVIIALVGLWVTGVGAIADMGFAGAFAVAIAVLIALTLLPVLLRGLGMRALSRKDRRQLLAGITVSATSRKRTPLNKWGSAVARRPVPALVGAAVVLAIVAVPLLSMKTAAAIPGGSDPRSTERHAYNLIVDKFGGVQSPLIVLAEGKNIEQKLGDVEKRLAGYSHVEAVIPGTVDVRGTTALITVIPSGGPIAAGTKSLVQDIRGDAAKIAGVHLEVTGETAIGLDLTNVMNQALIKYVLVIVILSFLLMILMFRSLLVPLFATLGYLLSLGAALGALTAVFQWGWLKGIIQAPQGDPLLSLLPIILVGVLFGLAMDYQVFLVSRIREGYTSGLSPKEAIVSGMTKSGPVLVAAALIMAFVFGGFASSTMTFGAETAFGLLVGVLADALLVRMVIMPALLSLVGHAAWWLPRWLDRIVPKLDTEGHVLEVASLPSPVDDDRELVGAK